MIIRFGLGLLVVVLLFLLLAYSDLYFTRRIKEKIAGINHNAEERYNFRPLGILHFALTSLLLWVPSYYLLTRSLLLEYRLLLTVVYWGGAAVGLYTYGRQKASPAMAWQSLPFWLGFALIAGIVILPCMAGIHALIK